MKKVTILLLSFCATVITSAQTKIDVKDAAKHIGEKVTVCAKVFGTKELSNVNFINLGASFPNSQLTVVVFAKDKGNFKNIADYDGKEICVTGTISEYKSKPQIVITKPEEIMVQNK